MAPTRTPKRNGYMSLIMPKPVSLATVALGEWGGGGAVQKVVLGICVSALECKNGNTMIF